MSRQARPVQSGDLQPVASAFYSSTELGPAPVESERELVEVRLKVVDLHGGLVGPQQPPLQEAGNPVNSRKGHVRLNAGAGDGDRARFHAVKQERPQRMRLRVLNGARPTAPEARWAEELDGHGDERPSGCVTPSLARLRGPM